MDAIIAITIGALMLGVSALFYRGVRGSQSKYEGEEQFLAWTAALSGAVAFAISGTIGVVWGLFLALRRLVR